MTRELPQDVKDRFGAEYLLTPQQVADLFAVDPKTVTRWAKRGKLKSIRTLGGHRRYRESDIRQVYFAETGVEPGFPGF